MEREKARRNSEPRVPMPESGTDARVVVKILL
jgi:hypothetical protein